MAVCKYEGFHAFFEWLERSVKRLRSLLFFEFKCSKGGSLGPVSFTYCFLFLSASIILLEVVTVDCINVR